MGKYNLSHREQVGRPRLQPCLFFLHRLQAKDALQRLAVGARLMTAGVDANVGAGDKDL